MSPLLLPALVFGCVAAISTLEVQLSDSRLGKYYPTTIPSRAFGRYNALGDSYSAGINSAAQLLTCNGSNGGDTGPYCTTTACAKNMGSYAWQFMQKWINDQFDFAACSGANTTDILQTQLPDMISYPDLLTISIGGNNGNTFASVVKNCVYLPLQPGCAGALISANDTVTNIGPALADVFAKIGENLYSDGVAVVLGYVTFWPINQYECQSSSLSRPSAAQKTTMNDLVIALNIALELAAGNAGFLFVNPNAAWGAHRLCDQAEPWIQWDLLGIPGFEDGDNDGLRDPDIDVYNRGVFHPNIDGQKLYLTLLEEALGYDTIGSSKRPNMKLDLV